MYNHGLAVAVLAVIIPILGRLLLSPMAMLILSPILVLTFLLLLILSNVILAFLVQNLRPTATSAHHQPARPLAFSTPAAWQAVLTRSKWSAGDDKKRAPIAPSYPNLSTLLDNIITYIMRDFVMAWYSDISLSPDFPNALDGAICAAAEDISRRLETLDLPSILVRRILPKITTHVEKFRQSEIALRGVGLERHLTQSDELDLLLASKYAGKEGKLHSAVENLSSPVTRQSEQAHLRSMMEKILPLIVPEKEIGSRSVLIVAREIVACVVLMPVMEMLADPDFWNRMVDQAAGAAIRQQKLISKVRSILEAQSSANAPPPSPLPTASSAALRGPRMEDITSRTAARQFESFLQSIKRCNSLLDVRRLKNDVSGEIRRTRLLLANHEKDEWINGEKASDIVAYLDRLYSAKKLCDERVTLLGGAPDDDSVSHQSVFREASSTEPLSLRDVLSNPSSLSYFMEFMDRRNRSSLVQFWLTVDSFKNPLEEVDSGSSGEDEDEDYLSAPVVTPPSATLRDDMSMIYELYFSNASSPSYIRAVSSKHIEAIRLFVFDSASTFTPAKEKKVRRSVLIAQRQVEKNMEEDFQDFERSELWFKAISDLEPRKKKLPGSSNHPPPLSLSHAQSHTLGGPNAPPSPSPTTSSLRPPNAPRSTSRPTFVLPPKPPRSGSSPAIHQSPNTDLWTSTNVGGSMTDGVRPTSMTAPIAASPSTIAPPKSNLAFLISGSGSDTTTEGARAPLFGDTDEADDGLVRQETIEQLQAALTDIIAHENETLENRGSQRRGHQRQDSTGSDGLPSLASSLADLRGVARTSSAAPSLTGSISKRRKVFEDDDDDEAYDGGSARFGSELGDDGDGSVHNDRHTVQVAAPGDLQLSYEVDRLTEKIGKLQAQETILDALIRKAELTGDAQELKILSRSKSSMARELRELTFQRSQYMLQEAENRLVPDRTKISIASSVVSDDLRERSGGGGKRQVVKYLIEVQQLSASDGSFASGWVVARRYNEFYVMHQRLREKIAVVRSLDFPPKKLVTSMSTSFVDTRRTGLEKYMQALVKIPLVCESEELRSFLSRQDTSLPADSGPMENHHYAPKTSRSASFLGQGLVRTMYRSVADSIDDIFFGPSMLDVMIQRLSQQAAEFAGIVGSGVHDEDLIAQALKAKVGSNAPGDANGDFAPVEEEALLSNLSSGDLKPLEGETGMSPFSAPICDLILAVFELDKKNNWLRKQAIVIILQQVLGSTIERKLRDVAKIYLDETHLVQYLTTFKDDMWPGGALKPPGTPRTLEEKAWTRDQANRKLSALMPDLAANMIGRSNARRGAGRMFAVLQNRRLNQHIAYSVLDEVLAGLFPEARLTT